MRAHPPRPLEIAAPRCSAGANARSCRMTRAAARRLRALRDGEHPPYEFPRYASSTRRAPKRPLFAPPRTLSELTGPVFSDGRRAAGRERPVARAGRRAGARPADDRDRPGAGRGRAAPVPGTLVELWQANTAGKYNHPADEFASAGRPALLGLRPLRHRRRGPLHASRRSSPAPTRSSTPATGGARRTSTSRCSARPSSPASSPRCISRASR